MSQATTEPSPLRRRIGFAALAFLLAIALGLAGIFFGARALELIAWHTYSVPSRSMEPTIRAGEYMLARFYVRDATPARGDLVVFRSPMNRDVEYFKRVIAIPGDRIQLRAGFVYLNGIKLEREPVDAPQALRPAEGKPIQYVETLPGGRRYHIEKLRDDLAMNDTPETVVPPGRYFVLGDNRDNSLDSRDRTFGLIPAQDLVARAYRVIWSDAFERIGTALD